MNLRKAIDQLEETILSGLHIPLTRQTLLDEEVMLERLDDIRVNLPQAIAEAEEIVKRQNEIVAQAHRYADEIIAAAQFKREQMLNHTGIVQQAEKQASEIRSYAQHEREELLRHAMGEADQMRSEMDRYADRMLQELEERLSQTLHVIQNGRVQLNSQANP
ncbi:hypothetical protein [Synechococcus sp. PCC 7336]|uniref:hypothetical protein n=1 Tax=Synechococcus sp. PCC 7336 TaxID=195250 RepID=UPI000349567B|nr:hypothetical protein [Synechococcus sp. PCC 7336]